MNRLEVLNEVVKITRSLKTKPLIYGMGTHSRYDEIFIFYDDKYTRFSPQKQASKEYILCNYDEKFCNQILG